MTNTERAEKIVTELHTSRIAGEAFDLSLAIEEALACVEQESWQACHDAYDSNRLMRFGNIALRPDNVERIDFHPREGGESSTVRFRNADNSPEIAIFSIENTTKLVARLNLVPKK